MGVDVLLNVAIFENRTFCIAKKNKSSQWACVISSSRYRSHIRDACCSCCRLLLSAVLCRVLVSQSPVIRLALAHHLSTSYIQSLIDIMAEQESDAGVVAGADSSLPILITMCAFLALSFYNMLELIVRILTTFKSRCGLYFWSFIAATAGILPYGIGFLLKFFTLTSIRWIPVALVGTGLVGIVTGQSLVLYSRLHLIVRDSRTLRWVLTMIMAFGVDSPHSERFLPVFLIYDKIQLTVFFTQECIISGIYIYTTVRLLAPAGEPISRPLRHLLTHLIIVNVFVLALDVTVLGFGFSGYYQIQTTFKAAVYSVKLKVEFSVLNRLVGIVKNKNLALGDFISGPSEEGGGTGRRLENLGESDGSRVFGSVGSGSTVVARGGFIRMDYMNNVSKEDVAPRVVIRERLDRQVSDIV